MNAHRWAIRLTHEVDPRVAEDIHFVYGKVMAQLKPLLERVSVDGWRIGPDYAWFPKSVGRPGRFLQVRPSSPNYHGTTCASPYNALNSGLSFFYANTPLLQRRYDQSLKANRLFHILHNPDPHPPTEQPTTELTTFSRPALIYQEIETAPDCSLLCVPTQILDNKMGDHCLRTQISDLQI